MIILSFQTLRPFGSQHVADSIRNMFQLWFILDLCFAYHLSKYLQNKYINTFKLSAHIDSYQTLKLKFHFNENYCARYIKQMQKRESDQT